MRKRKQKPKQKRKQNFKCCRKFGAGIQIGTGNENEQRQKVENAMRTSKKREIFHIKLLPNVTKLQKTKNPINGC